MIHGTLQYGVLADYEHLGVLVDGEHEKHFKVLDVPFVNLVDQVIDFLDECGCIDKGELDRNDEYDVVTAVNCMVQHIYAEHAPEHAST